MWSSLSDGKSACIGDTGIRVAFVTMACIKNACTGGIFVVDTYANRDTCAGNSSSAGFSTKGACVQSVIIKSTDIEGTCTRGTYFGGACTGTTSTSDAYTEGTFARGVYGRNTSNGNTSTRGVGASSGAVKHSGMHWQSF